MKILFVIDHFRNPYAGTEGQLHKLIRSLVKRRHDVHLLVFSSSDFTASGQVGCPVTVLGDRRLFSLRMWWKLWAVARAFRADGYRFAHVFFNDPSVICPPVFRAAGIRTIISRRDMGYWYSPGYLAFLRFNSRIVAGAIVNSTAVKERTAQKEGIRSDAIRVIYNGLDTVSPDSENSLDLKAWRTKQNVVLVGVVANIRPIKRICDAIQALAVLKDKVPSLRLALVGDGDPSELRRLAADLNVENRVFFAGPRSPAVDSIIHFDIGLLCSESEGFSNSIIEYMLCGLPVVCTNVGGNPEAVDDGVNGFLYGAGDVDTLAARLALLAQDPKLRRKMGQAGKDKAARYFSVDVMVDQHLAVYQDVLGLADKNEQVSAH